MSCPRVALVVGLGLMAASTAARAQELEPRAYSNSPVGTNFAVVSYAYSEPGLSVDPSLQLEDVHLHVHTGVVAYARVLDFAGMSGKADVVVPVSWLWGSALLAGEPAQREVGGLGDPRLRVSVNLYGAPALDAKQFRAYKRDLVIGGSLQVSAPLGQYDPSKLVNIGTNRWAMRADLGGSKAFGALEVDVTVSLVLYGENDDFFGGKTLERSPLYSVQGNASWEFGGGCWAAAGITYYRGGRNIVDGDPAALELGNVRAGGVLVIPMPVPGHHSIKLFHDRGVHTRTGANFNTWGIAWQVLWGAGL